MFLILVLFTAEGPERAVREVPSVAECHRMASTFQGEENLKTLSADFVAVGAACEVRFNTGSPS